MFTEYNSSPLVRRSKVIPLSVALPRLQRFDVGRVSLLNVAMCRSLKRNVGVEVIIKARGAGFPSPLRSLYRALEIVDVGGDALAFGDLI